MTELPPPGIYRDVPPDVYASWPALRSTALKQCARTLAHARWVELNGDEEETEALRFGVISHAHVLEPERIADRYVVKPQFGRKKAELARKKEWEESHSDKEWCTQADLDLVARIVAAIEDNKGCRTMLECAVAKELSLVWQDPDTGLMCKARIDMVSRMPVPEIGEGLYTVIGDFKTAASVEERAFGAAIAKYGYHLSLAFYRRGLDALSPAPAERLCAIMAVEKGQNQTRVTGPTIAKSYLLWPDEMAVADDIVCDMMALYKQAADSGEWDAYGQPMSMIAIPEYGLRRL